MGQNTAGGGGNQESKGEFAAVQTLPTDDQDGSHQLRQLLLMCSGLCWCCFLRVRSEPVTLCSAGLGTPIEVCLVGEAEFKKQVFQNGYLIYFCLVKKNQRSYKP